MLLPAESLQFTRSASGAKLTPGIAGYWDKIIGWVLQSSLWTNWLLGSCCLLVGYSVSRNVLDHTIIVVLKNRIFLLFFISTLFLVVFSKTQ